MDIEASEEILYEQKQNITSDIEQAKESMKMIPPDGNDDLQKTQRDQLNRCVQMFDIMYKSKVFPDFLRQHLLDLQLSLSNYVETMLEVNPSPLIDEMEVPYMEIDDIADWNWAYGGMPHSPDASGVSLPVPVSSEEETPCPAHKRIRAKSAHPEVRPPGEDTATRFDLTYSDEEVPVLTKKEKKQARKDALKAQKPMTLRAIHAKKKT